MFNGQEITRVGITDTVNQEYVCECVKEYILGSLHVCFGMCVSRLGVTEILIALRLTGRGPSRSRNAPIPSTSLISTDTSGLQRFPVKLSDLYV